MSPPSPVAPPQDSPYFSPPAPTFVDSTTESSSIASPPSSFILSIFTASAPTGPPLTESPPPPGRAPPIGLIIGTVIGLVVIVGFCVIFFIWRKRRRITLSGLHDRSPHPLQPKAGEEVGASPQHWPETPPPPPPPTDGGPKLPPKHSSISSTTSQSERPNLASSPSPSNIALGVSPRAFTYEELELATGGFSDSNFLGQGGFGVVHKGVLTDNKIVAIKQLRSGSKQGLREFQTEVEVISRVHHRHLVSLVGFCVAETQRTLMLVYEFVPNKTLEFHLHENGTATMDWITRMKIAIGSAKGLAYLHEDCQPKIIHRDIKAANILLDDNFEPKVADFGLAKFSSDIDTHVSTRIIGTFGYLAPEYAASGKLTAKSDVFSFGVVLLELITGRKPASKTQSYADDSMVEWAMPLLSEALENRKFEVIADPRLQKYNCEEMFQMVSCAANCVRHSARRRPRMSQVVQALEGNICLDDVNEEISIPKRQWEQQEVKKMRKGALEAVGYSTSESDQQYYQSTSSSSGSKIFK